MPLTQVVYLLYRYRYKVEPRSIRSSGDGKISLQTFIQGQIRKQLVRSPL
jgi:hypothetical protein